MAHLSNDASRRARGRRYCLPTPAAAQQRERGGSRGATVNLKAGPTGSPKGSATERAQPRAEQPRSEQPRSEAQRNVAPRVESRRDAAPRVERAVPMAQCGRVPRAGDRAAPMTTRAYSPRYSPRYSRRYAHRSGGRATTTGLIYFRPRFSIGFRVFAGLSRAVHLRLSVRLLSRTSRRVLLWRCRAGDRAGRSGGLRGWGVCGSFATSTGCASR